MLKKNEQESHDQEFFFMLQKSLTFNGVKISHQDLTFIFENHLSQLVV